VHIDFYEYENYDLLLFVLLNLRFVIIIFIHLGSSQRYEPMIDSVDCMILPQGLSAGWCRALSTLTGWTYQASKLISKISYRLHRPLHHRSRAKNVIFSYSANFYSISVFPRLMATRSRLDLGRSHGIH